MSEGTFFDIVTLPYPWPPSRLTLLVETPFEDRVFRIEAQDDGTILFTVTHTIDGKLLAFVSQPFIVLGNRPRPIALMMRHDSSKCWATLLNGQGGEDLLPNALGAPSIKISPLNLPIEKSFESPNTTAICQPWINKRHAKFSPSKAAREGRDPKTIGEEAEDLKNSSLTMKHLVEEVTNGKTFLQGSLIGEIRASVYWPENRDSKPDSQWNPLLLRMASKADLPLPVYCVPEITRPEVAEDLDFHLTMELPRIECIVPSEKIFDLQSVLLRTIVRSRKTRQREINSLTLIKELAHTMGAAHYDSDSHEFAKLMATILTERQNQITGFICTMASTIVALSDWVLAELEQRGIIT